MIVAVCATGLVWFVQLKIIYPVISLLRVLIISGIGYALIEMLLLKVIAPRVAKLW